MKFNRNGEEIMKKRLITIVAGICALALLGGCAGGTISNDNITIKQYKGLEVDKVEEITVTDEDVEMSIQSTLQTLSTKTDITDRPAQEGDMVVIDYEGKVDGVAFEGGTATEQSVEIGAGMFVPGFEEGIIGHNIGETFDVNVTFPEQYAEELAGKQLYLR